MDATNKSSWMDVQCRPGAGNVMRLHVADASVCRLIALHADMRPGLTVIKTALETNIANRKRHSATHIRQLHQQRRSTGTQRQRAACESRARTAIRRSDLSPIVSKRARQRHSSCAIGSTAHCDHPDQRQRNHTRRRVHLQASTFTGSASAHHLKE
ncbi:hypothetical protein JH306_08895 [Xanthomonas campestris pv. campestris]|uniref:hypothetical protein n=1 Tax=Xanthomonas campestris TaxID=339 RepID=UPI002368A079|nr:hypothetical protein [Xanthomonas campestris]MEA0966844.1 hypothetical protein [Xanthomonas campestris pv. campestris]WDJ57506.1 hypothetical protein JH306_08895 [Xanthomonas campestris pv. campestris]